MAERRAKRQLGAQDALDRLDRTTLRRSPDLFNFGILPEVSTYVGASASSPASPLTGRASGPASSHGSARMFTAGGTKDRRRARSLVLQLHFPARLKVDFSGHFIVADAPIDPLKQK